MNGYFVHPFKGGLFSFLMKPSIACMWSGVIFSKITVEFGHETWITSQTCIKIYLKLASGTTKVFPFLSTLKKMALRQCRGGRGRIFFHSLHFLL